LHLSPTTPASTTAAAIPVAARYDTDGKEANRSDAHDSSSKIRPERKVPLVAGTF